MTIEILQTQIINAVSGEPAYRAVEITVSDGINTYLWRVGGLPLEGNLQAILDAREAELWTVAQAGGRTVDLYELTLKRVLKAFALVVLDEINILRQAAGLAPRTGGQIDNAIKAKLKALQ